MNSQEIYQNQIMQDRKERDTAIIQSPLNWLSLSGLFLLPEGENTISNSAAATVMLEKLPEDARMVILITGEEVNLSQASGEIFINGKPAAPQSLFSDVTGSPDVLESGALSMMVIRRGGRFYLRVWDREAQALKEFHGLNYYRVDAAFRVLAEYIPFTPPIQKMVRDAIGGVTQVTFPGRLRFELFDVTCELIAEEADDQLLLNFTDLTKMDTTYPAGRYLVINKPEGCEATLDFNLAQNWPCAYTPFATCPLPPAENHLAVRIEAGEKRYHD